MIKYTIIMQDDNRSATAYIETKRPLVGNEPVIAERLAALNTLTEPEDNYWIEFKKALIKQQESKKKRSGV